MYKGQGAATNLKEFFVSHLGGAGFGGGGGRGCEVRCGACNRVFGVMLCVPSFVPINNEVQLRKKGKRGMGEKRKGPV